MGLLSDGGVHTDISHLFALLDVFKAEKISDVFVHPFLDGRDTSPKSGKGYVISLENKLKEIKIGKIADVMGRYYAMDRDKRWDRVKKAYDAMVFGQGNFHTSAVNAVQESYDNSVTDEFMIPTVIVDKK